MKTNRIKTGNDKMDEVQAINDDQLISGRNFYKLFWIFMAGGFWGFLTETLWCIITDRRFEWRAGLVCLPINPVYGFGAVLLYILFYNMDRNKKIKIFATGVAAGAAVEYICSFVQEKLFGTVSWDYSDYPLNIGSRICLRYSIFWGFLALAWVALVCPFFERIISKIPSSFARPLTWVSLSVVVVVTVVSASAVSRWAIRVKGNAEENSYSEVFLDEVFPDSSMEKLYPNMKFLH